jgi:hypothetical protein
MAGKLVGRNKNAPKRRMNAKHLAERESTPAQVKHWIAWRDADRCWLVDLPETTSENGNK